MPMLQDLSFDVEEYQGACEKDQAEPARRARERGSKRDLARDSGATRERVVFAGP
ncbi:hypothetical protein AURDEDRAFT_172102 [Auricularia subglabra TFB-10046 SS5]|nr:hypothetical protein AURDEDRAFT_172102 [Auricularia subglabra TFB-10046 SS5]